MKTTSKREERKSDEIDRKDELEWHGGREREGGKGKGGMG